MLRQVSTKQTIDLLSSQHFHNLNSTFQVSITLAVPIVFLEV